MLKNNREGVIFVVIFLLTGMVSWWMMLRPITDYDADRFDSLPTELNGWQAIDLEMDESVSEMLNADHNVQRAYFHEHGYVVFVYIGYYGTRRGGTPEHTPDICYPAQGWSIADAAERRIGGDDGLDLQEFLVEKDGEQRLVHFWYRTGHSTGITSIFGLRVEHFWGRLTRNRADGALVRLSTIVRDSDVPAARSRLLGLDVVVEAELARLWEGEPEGLQTALRKTGPSEAEGDES